MRKTKQPRRIADLSREELDREFAIWDREFEVLKTYPLGSDGACFLKIVARKPERAEVSK